MKVLHATLSGDKDALVASQFEINLFIAVGTDLNAAFCRFKGGRDVIEEAAQFGAYGKGRGQDRDGDTASDQTVFNCSCALPVFPELGE